VHRDLKPSNLLVNSKGEVKICDFGVSVLLLLRKAQALTLIGSTAYMSPERVRGLEHGAASDVWSVGLSVAECALGVFPIVTDELDLPVCKLKCYRSSLWNFCGVSLCFVRSQLLAL
jgi:serine/threonine protein kinase